ncbi:MAG: right-handed parallel beta-helix repeat-containing protein [Elusimicrobia bacterium]|nr:right-handed parallel beta-helix repeat-containing protein [Elusimicrobiota bacterium]
MTKVNYITFKKFARLGNINAFIFLLLFSLISAPRIYSQSIGPISPEISHRVANIGTDFSVFTVEGDTVALASQEPIKLLLMAIRNNMLILNLEKTRDVSATQLKISGLLPSISYIIREDGIEKFEIVSSSNGEIAYTQDISAPHTVFIIDKRIKSSVYINPDGSISPPTAPIEADYTAWPHITYKLTGDLNEPLIIARSDITIDGNGYAVIHPGYIPGQWFPYGVYSIRRSTVTIKNLTVTGPFDYGIFMEYATNCRLEGNRVTGALYGIHQMGGKNTVYFLNAFTFPYPTQPYGQAMFFWNVSFLTVKHNTIGDSSVNAYTGYGIGIGGWAPVSHSVFESNVIYNVFAGIDISGFNTETKDNAIDSNYFIKNKQGIRIGGGSNSFVENSFSENETGFVFKKDDIERLINPVVEGHNIIQWNGFVDTATGIWLKDARSEHINYNTFTAPNLTPTAIAIYNGANDNDITQNTMDSVDGIYMAGGNGNIISENTIKNSNKGVVLDSPLISGNTIYHNNFINNAVQVDIKNAGKNYWNVGYAANGGGNYYSDYIEPAYKDKQAGPKQNLLPPIEIPDNIIDTARGFDANNVDQYPFVSTDSWKKPIENANPDFSQIAVSTDNANFILISTYPDAPIIATTAVNVPHGFKISGLAYKLEEYVFGPQGAIISFVCPVPPPYQAKCDGITIQKYTESLILPWKDIPFSSDPAKGTVSAFISSSSIFALLVPIDNLSPRTALNIGEPKYTNAFTYISSETALLFVAEDDAFEIGDKAGVGMDKTYFAVDIDTFGIYANPFSIISEGTRTIKFYSIDKIGNTEIVKSSIVAVDNTPPITEFLVNGATVQGSVVAFETGYFGFKAADPINNNVNSELKLTEFSIDDNPFSIYSATFSLTLGEHIISFKSFDNVNNKEGLKTISVKIIPPLLITLDLDPDTLNLKSQGNYITAYIEVSGTKATEDIKPETLKVVSINDETLSTPIALVQETAGKSGKLKFAEIGDYDEDGILDLMIKFDRQAVIEVLPIGEQVGIAIQGNFKDGEEFTTGDYLRTILPGNVSASLGGSVIHSSKAEIKIPQNALEMDGDLTILKLTKEPQEKERPKQESADIKNIKRTGKPYEFGPEGLRFNKPVEINLPYDAAEISADEENWLKIAYWNPDTKDWEILSSKVDKVNKTVIAQTTHFSTYQILIVQEKPLEVPANFELGEIYAFPNPAKRGINPAIHIEAGIADRIDINIYDITGQLIKSAILTGSPQLIDDGQGAEYAYEWTWDASNTGSGVYIYVVKAHKNGETLKAIRKLGIIK